MNILHIDCSPRPDSHSRQLSAAIVDKLIELAPGAAIRRPDFLTPYLAAVLDSIGLKTLQFVAVQATAFLDQDQATSAREKALAALDLTVMGELPCLI